MRLRELASMVVSLLCAHAAVAQTRPPEPSQRAREPLQLAALQEEALKADPRGREVELQDAQTELRVHNIDVERRPSVSAAGLAQYQSDAPTSPFTTPTGTPLFAAPKDVFDASLRIDQRLFDPTIHPRLALARADRAESQARLRSTLFGLRQEVNEAFFTAALFQEEAGALAATIAAIEGRLKETSARVREGTAIEAESAALEATLLQRRQDADELAADRSAALARLAQLAHREIDDRDVLALPDLAGAVAEARRSLSSVRARPEYEQFRSTRDRLARQQDVTLAQEQPQLSAFARVGYGKPGLNFISTEFEPYATVGVQLQWKAWTWGTANREKQALGLQQQIVAADEAAFADALRRTVQIDLATIDRLQTSLATDDRIVALREVVERSDRLRQQEGVVTASTYLDRNAELLGARFARSSHRVELARASARLLTTLGLEVR